MLTISDDDNERKSSFDVAAGDRTVLLIEDDVAIAEQVLAAVAERGLAVLHAGTAAEADALLESHAVDVMVVDRMLPGIDGLTAVSLLRQRGVTTPALILSALSSVDDRLDGFRAGADDYLVKPFAIEELFARVESLLRRPTDARATVLNVGPLKLDLLERAAFRGGQRIELLPREFQLLDYMMRRPDRTLTRAMLLEDVWNYKFVPQTNVVDVHISRLRKKIDVAGKESVIQAVAGIGFILRS